MARYQVTDAAGRVVSETTSAVDAYLFGRAYPSPTTTRAVGIRPGWIYNDRPQTAAGDMTGESK